MSTRTYATIEKILAQETEAGILDKSPIHPVAIADGAIERAMKGMEEKKREALWAKRNEFAKDFSKHANDVVSKDEKLKKDLKSDATYVRDALHAEADVYLASWMKKHMAAASLLSSVYGQYFDTQEDQGKNLIVKLTDAGKEEFKEQDEHAVEQAFEEFVVADKGWQFVPPADIGALTDSVIFGDVSMDDHGTVTEIHSIWWYPEYELKSYGNELKTKGEVKFTHAE